MGSFPEPDSHPGAIELFAGSGRVQSANLRTANPPGDFTPVRGTLAFSGDGSTTAPLCTHGRCPKTTGRRQQTAEPSSRFPVMNPAGTCYEPCVIPPDPTPEVSAERASSPSLCAYPASAAVSSGARRLFGSWRLQQEPSGKYRPRGRKAPGSSSRRSALPCGCRPALQQVSAELGLPGSSGLAGLPCNQAPVAALYLATMSAGTRPRSLMSKPFSLAHSRTL
jgi:hypothetical protein